MTFLTGESSTETFRRFIIAIVLLFCLLAAGIWHMGKFKHLFVNPGQSTQQQATGQIVKPSPTTPVDSPM